MYCHTPPRDGGLYIFFKFILKFSGRIVLGQVLVEFPMIVHLCDLSLFRFSTIYSDLNQIKFHA